MRTQLGQDSESMELRLFPSSLTLKLSQTEMFFLYFIILKFAVTGHGSKHFSLYLKIYYSIFEKKS